MICSPFTADFRRLTRSLTIGAAALAVSGCMVGPHYQRASAPVSPRFKELRPAPGWTYAQPEQAAVAKGEWWRIYRDPQLDALESQVALNNQNVAEYEARYRAARAEINAVRAQLFPTLSGSFSFSRNAQGGGSQNSASGSVISSSTGYTKNTYSIGPSASWDLDIWGKIRRQIQAQVTESQASAADLANARLSYQAQLATAYFNLHYQDSLHALLARNVAFYTDALRITQNQVEAGTSDPTAVLEARYQLEQTRASETATQTLRAQYEHAIAVLIGKPPADVSIPVAELSRDIPAIPVTVPAELLQRRPDVAAAERRMEEYNADIGAAIAAFFPSITLSASYEQSGDPIGTIMNIGNRIWSLGASATETLFEGGSRTAAVHQANATYDNYVAQYRQTVLTALQNTEDQLSNLRILADQAAQQDVALRFANQAVTVSMNQYLAGTVIYTSVITNEQSALSIAQSALSIQQSRMVDSVSLIEALGGGWSVTELPSKGSMQTDNPFLPSFIQKDKN
ncbi:secretion system type I outer membrane efflux pump lipoprotein NodT [Ameyamaea chiangmaiensis NBRC 103196]|uniref:Efflux transporter outer membrane subunit n=1 Tax=Ameyamaea chiangmaiensis TaxID=442969 RepID=A0A850PF18_9PROT|nr:efflux transporter outer membrane subunit [Ameyamaea chiangmaiensis]MBS4073991.1 efflux transporter outer membrane subunit [Ameyamaea chiangmaiensis]NVN40846.1 efflux transporter outer membrane subunit [Ameyamaea chiangmaiensis]GBQ67687.1 secretion system type I outer membrane efflux pump lipoprotein NodT [Ameyamaea chiangmaiensis NBRC 103196]